MNLADHVRADVAAGAVDYGTSLGIQKMPAGYCLMLLDNTHFYWLRHDGESSDISCDKWQIWRWANYAALKESKP
jgi:hypothetical protein